MKILGFDIQGTRLGWAVLDGDVLVAAGVQLLGVREVAGKRAGTWKKIVLPSLYAYDARQKVEQLLGRYRPDVVAYEKVVRHGPGSTSAHSWGAVEMAVLEVCEFLQKKWDRLPVEHTCEIQAVAVCSAKLALAGKGNATKEEMVAAAEAKWPDARVDWDEEDGDAADAAGVAWSVEHPGESKAAKAKREAGERRAAKAVR
jgi:Holliday junction resolvasome RuvABC endonuclease subunit